MTSKASASEGSAATGKGNAEMRTTQGSVDKRALLSIEREVLDENQYLANAGYTELLWPSLKDDLLGVYRHFRPKLPKLSQKKLKMWLFSILPILKWTSEYQIRKFLPYDVVAGVTVGIMHIPQGLGYASLARVEPVRGLYVALLPAIVYVLLGTSHHNSMGTFAVVMYMTGFAIDQTFFENPQEIPPYTREELMTLMTFAIGIWQIVLGITRMGSLLSVLLSDTLVSGFTTGAAFLVITSQVPTLFGLETTDWTTTFPKHFHLHYLVLTRMHLANTVAVVISVFTMTVLIINNDLMRKMLLKFCPFPFPMELVLMCIGIGLSTWLNLASRHGVQVIGTIPLGLPYFRTFPLELLWKKEVIIWSMAIGLVSFTTSYSMGRILARKWTYDVLPNQELLAMGTANVVGSFFMSGPIAASLSRSVIQQVTGGVTQVASIVSALLLVFVLLVVAKFFEMLPTCVLASLIVVSLKGLFLQFEDLEHVFWTNRLDSFIWFATFFTVVLVDIEWGLVAGLGMSFAALLWTSYFGEATALGQIPGTELFANPAKFTEASFTLDLGGVLHFANVAEYRRMLSKKTDFDPECWFKHMTPAAETLQKKGLLRRSFSSAKSKLISSSQLLPFVGPLNGKRDVSKEVKQFTDLEKVRRPTEKPVGVILDEDLEVYSNNEEISDFEPWNFEKNEEEDETEPDQSQAVENGAPRRNSIHVDRIGNPLPLRYLIIDLSSTLIVDLAAIQFLKTLVVDYDRVNVQILFAGPTVGTLEKLLRSRFIEDQSPMEFFFPTLFDAVTYARHRGYQHIEPRPYIPNTKREIKHGRFPLAADLRIEHNRRKLRTTVSIEQPPEAPLPRRRRRRRHAIRRTWQIDTAVLGFHRMTKGDRSGVIPQSQLQPRHSRCCRCPPCHRGTRTQHR
ncbi:unnamed protein product [Notodromas monacha]|uniref:STAS domain-containing protein n=1 Tax=Notodromas monacha TaxID=399045 RepID=A0A7R9GDK7_9CRUS|nr:unnamed protein product [Notodromas monacha]CAG0918639.1 unnamed protein product [Notodromas monacha]